MRNSDPKSPTPKTQYGLRPEELRWHCDASALGFVSTAELEPLTGLVGQERALKAIRFGTSIEQPAYSLFIVGPPGIGKTTAVRSFLQKTAEAKPTPPDWVYVNNFSAPRKPHALRLPPGRGRRLVDAMANVVEELVNSLPATFESEDYLNRRRSIDDEFRSHAEAQIEAFQQRAAEQKIVLLQTQMGFVMAPRDEEGNVVPPETFSKWPEDERQKVEQTVLRLQEELETVLKQLPRRHKERLERIRTLNEELAETAVNQAADFEHSAVAAARWANL